MKLLDTAFRANVVDVIARTIYFARVTIRNGRLRIHVLESKPQPGFEYVVPGLFDSHIHIESSLLVPREFIRLVVRHGTIAVAADPHEIANVCGISGVEWMWKNGADLPFYIAWGAPSCVPATNCGVETAGAVIDAEGVRRLLASRFTTHLAEMMNFPGVIQGDSEVFAKLAAAKDAGKPIDGHAPKLRGENLRRYTAAGIDADHEETTLEGGQEKIRRNMRIQIREGSAARNFGALHPLFAESPEMLLFATDDLHPDVGMRRHIDELVRRSLALGYNVFDVLRAASLNPKLRYNIPMGMLQDGDPADLVVVNNLDEFIVTRTIIQGHEVARRDVPQDCPVGEASMYPCISFIEQAPVEPINHFACSPITTADIEVQARPGLIRAIQVHDGELITSQKLVEPTIMAGRVMPDARRDVLKLVVVNRYQDDGVPVPPAVGFVTDFGMQDEDAAIASSVAHDGHHIVAIGSSDEAIVRAVNLLVEHQGGLVAVRNGQTPMILPLPIAGLMSDQGAFKVAEQYIALDNYAKDLGCRLEAPFMALSFLILLVIPALKLSDKSTPDRGPFDGDLFQFVPLFVEQPAAV